MWKTIKRKTKLIYYFCLCCVSDVFFKIKKTAGNNKKKKNVVLVSWNNCGVYIKINNKQQTRRRLSQKIVDCAVIECPFLYLAWFLKK